MYNYQEIKPMLFTDDGQRMFLKARDLANELLKKSGAFRLNELMRELSGSTWDMIACVDRMVELGEIQELKYPYEPFGQHRVFTSTNREL